MECNNPSMVNTRLWQYKQGKGSHKSTQAITINSYRTHDSKVHGANMGAIWDRQDPGGPHFGPMNFVVWDWIFFSFKMLLFLSEHTEDQKSFADFDASCGYKNSFLCNCSESVVVPMP